MDRDQDQHDQEGAALPEAVPAGVAPLALRRAKFSDVERLVELNRAAYPDLVEENVVYDAGMIRAHLAVFPAGQLVATRDGAIVGALSTMIVRSELALAPHTWIGITHDGSFAGHDPQGDTLYLADIYVDPAAWGTRVGQFLYRALQQLCRAQGLSRIVAGGRMWGLSRFGGTPEQYVAAVESGMISDRVLGSQLRAGFAVRGILPGYLHDARSRSYATLLEWVRDG
jgi:GNAT superfamily N-acetyltransferase